MHSVLLSQALLASRVGDMVLELWDASPENRQLTLDDNAGQLGQPQRIHTTAFTDRETMVFDDQLVIVSEQGTFIAREQDGTEREFYAYTCLPWRP